MTDFERFIIENNLRKKDVAAFIGVSAAFISQVVSGLRLLPAEKLSVIMANPAWDTSMLKPATVSQRGRQNVIVSGQNTGFVGEMKGGTFVHNGGKDQVIEEQKSEISKMFEAIILAVGGFQKASERHDDYVVRQDDYIKRQDEYIARIINNSYQRNKENMERLDRDRERIDVQFTQQNKLIEMVLEQNKRTQDRTDRLFDLLEKKI